MKKIIRFTAGWCQPCKSMALQLENMKLEIPIEVVDIDVYPDIAIQYGIRGVPTLVMVDDHGNVANKLVGLKMPNEIRKWIND